jgi:hypothetical protein
MSKYLLMLVEDETGYANADEATFNAVMAGHGAFQAYAGERNLGGHALQPTSTATTVSGFGTDRFTVTDGPFAESKEAIGGYYLIEAKDLDEAIELAKRVPTPFGGIEIRPIMTFD